jgi:hypothetical protein
VAVVCLPAASAMLMHMHAAFASSSVYMVCWQPHVRFRAVTTLMMLVWSKCHVPLLCRCRGQSSTLVTPCLCGVGLRIH